MDVASNGRFTNLRVFIALTPSVNVIESHKNRKTVILMQNHKIAKWKNDAFHSRKIKYDKTAKVLTKWTKNTRKRQNSP